jgi:dTDP-4-amino-4,6-dideoxygalactose transaminase
MSKSCDEEIFVSRPSLPLLSELQLDLEKIWSSRVMTNNGPYVKELESRLERYLGVKWLSIFNNGTTTLLAAISALKLKGEIITTPFTFAATASSIVWAGCEPVFVDVNLETANICPKAIKNSITEKTVAIMAVHCYGNVCQVEEIEKIATEYNLKVIYDAAHTFGVNYKDRSILSFGDVSSLSFHATKVFNTVEGGALVANNEGLYSTVNNIRNFGIINEDEISEVGINGKMNEILAAYGILNLKLIDLEIVKRKQVASQYLDLLSGVRGLKFLRADPNQTQNYAYFPVVFDECNRVGRDEMYEKLKRRNIYARKYFSPLLSEVKAFSRYVKKEGAELVNAKQLSKSVLCLPIYADMSPSDIMRVASVFLEGM